MSQALALFDLDNTLISGDSDYEWGQFLVDRGVLERGAYEAQNRAYYEQYVAGTLDIHEFLGFALRPLAAHEPADLERWHAEFMAARIRPMIGAPARALVRKHLGAGDLCARILAWIKNAPVRLRAGESARRVVEAGIGAADRSTELVESLFSGG